jgi:serine/threonine protein kinase
MGHVYRAFDLKRGRPVALKVASSSAPQEQARIAHEAELQGQLNHSAVPRILRTGRLPDGRAYLVQTLVRGARTLDAAVETVSPLQKLEWMAAAAEALAIAHGRCVVHGDVKPENLLVDARGRLSVIDWGVSQLAECAARSPVRLSPSMRDYARRHRSWICGTLAYMSPEQLRGRAVPASDVYSLGVVLYEVFVGAHPRAALFDDPDRLIHEIRNEPSPAVPDGLPAPLPDLIRSCLRRNPELRPASVEVAWTLRRQARNERRSETHARCVGDGASLQLDTRT